MSMSSRANQTPHMKPGGSDWKWKESECGRCCVPTGKFKVWNGMTLRPKSSSVISSTLGLRASARTLSLIFHAFLTRCQCHSPSRPG